MEFTHAKFGRMEIAEFTQAQMERYGEAMVGKESQSLPQYYGECVRTAVRVGVLIEPRLSDEEIANAKPAQVKWLAINVLNAVAEANNVDPLP